ncbi:MAG: sigma-70 family RNA polymerase sigma factor, partial [Bacteroidales bacterium]|nr:sigma-70 family RNA polymerase sigma factor [Bacteroidales bacterium]
KDTARKFYRYSMLNMSENDDSGYLTNRIESEVLWEVFSKVEQLPAECKKVFKLSYLENMSNQEIADMLSISVNTVKSQKSRAKQLLKESLKGLFVFAVAIFGL